MHGYSNQFMFKIMCAMFHHIRNNDTSRVSPELKSSSGVYRRYWVFGRFSKIIDGIITQIICLDPNIYIFVLISGTVVQCDG